MYPRTWLSYERRGRTVRCLAKIIDPILTANRPQCEFRFVSAEVTVSDLTYLAGGAGRYSSDRLHYQKAMLESWFRTRLSRLARRPADQFILSSLDWREMIGPRGAQEKNLAPQAARLAGLWSDLDFERVITKVVAGARTAGLLHLCSRPCKEPNGKPFVFLDQVRVRAVVRFHPANDLARNPHTHMFQVAVIPHHILQ